MSRYFRVRSLFESSSTAGLTNTQQQSHEKTVTSDEGVTALATDAETGGTTVQLSHLNSCSWLMVEHAGTSGTVQVEWYSQTGTRAAGNLVITAGPPGVINDVAAGMISSGAAVASYVRCAASEDAANDGKHLLQAATTTDVTTPDTLTANADDDTMTLSFERKNKVVLAAGGVLLINDTIVASENVTLTGSATIACRVSYIGT